MSPALCLTPITPGTDRMIRARSWGDRYVHGTTL